MCQHLASTINTCLAESTFALTLVCVVWSSVGSRLVWATHGLPFRAPVYRGVSCLDPPVCLRVQDDPEVKSQPIVVLVGVLRSCDGRGREKRVCVQLRVLTPLLDWKRCSSSQSHSFSVISSVSFVPCVPSVPLVPSRIRSKFSEGVSTRFVFACVPTNPSPCSRSHRFSCLPSAVSQSVLFTLR